jgi:hypothetical protein
MHQQQKTLSFAKTQAIESCPQELFEDFTASTYVAKFFAQESASNPSESSPPCPLPRR